VLQWISVKIDVYLWCKTSSQIGDKRTSQLERKRLVPSQLERCIFNLLHVKKIKKYIKKGLIL